MLIVLSGCETIHKKFFGRRITGALNTFKIDGYTVDFKTDNFEITDPNGKLVHRASDGTVEGINELLNHPVDGSHHQPGYDIFQKALVLQQELLLEGSRNNHFGPGFLNLWYDYGIFPTAEDYNINSRGFLHPHQYQDVLDNYKNRKHDTLVVTGIFSRQFIDSIKTDLGAANVKVLNIIRNPSVCFMLNEKSADYYKVPHPVNFRTPLMDHKKLQWSIWNAHNLTRFDDVTTLKFEDIIKEGTFEVEGATCIAPDGYDSHNTWLTKWERDNLVSTGIVAPNDVSDFNRLFTDFAPYNIDHEFSTRYPEVQTRADFIALANKLNGTSLPASAMDVIPVDMFKALGYTPLTYGEIVNS